MIVRAVPGQPSLPVRVGRALRRSPLLCLFAAGAAGIVAADSGRWIILALLALVFAGGAAFLKIRRKPGWSIAAGTCLCLTGFAWLHENRLGEIEHFPLSAAMEEGRKVEISGTGWVSEVPKAVGGSVSAVLRLEEVSVRGTAFACDHSVPAWIRKPPEGMAYGSRVRFTGLLEPLEGPGTPGGFDAKRFYFRQHGSLARLSIRDGDLFKLMPGIGGNSLVRHAQRLRTHLENGLLLGLRPEDEPYARLIAAMTLGARENAPDELEEFFERSGTMHLFAVSGLHVGVVYGFLSGIALFAGFPKRRAVLVIIPLILLYALLTGLRPSAVRAAVMLSIFLGGIAINERSRLLNSLGVAGLVILAWDTQELFLPGFQLSFLVLLFIALFATSLGRRIAQPFLTDPFIPRTLLSPAQRWSNGAARGIAVMLAVSIAAWLGSAGLLSWHFQSVAPVGILANLLMIAVASVIIAIAAVSLILFGAKLTLLATVTNKLNVGLAILLTGMAEFFSGLPGAYLHVGTPGAARPDPEELRIDAMGDRGESAILVSVPGEDARKPIRWLVDCGSPRTYRSQVLPLMRSRGINSIDTLLLTHGDQGHIGAAPEVMKKFRPRILIESSAENRARIYPDIVALLEKRGIEGRRCDAGAQVELPGGTSCRILFPFPGTSGRIADDRAMVLQFEFHGWKILLTSDAGFETEKSLIDSGTDLESDVWIRGQHHAGISGLPEFIEAVNPRIVISSHEDFPLEESMPRHLTKILDGRGTRLFRLDGNGIVTLSAFPDKITVSSHGGGQESVALPPR